MSTVVIVVVVVVMKMQLHYCSHPVWTMHVVRDILKHESQRTGPGIHCRKVIMSRVGCTSANVCMRRGSIAQPETGTSIVVILHKTLNLTSHNGVAGIFTAYRDFVGPRHSPSPITQKCKPWAHYLNPRVRVRECDTAKRNALGRPWPPRLVPQSGQQHRIVVEAHTALNLLQGHG